MSKKKSPRVPTQRAVHAPEPAAPERAVPATEHEQALEPDAALIAAPEPGPARTRTRTRTRKKRAPAFNDAVTILEISPPESGGVSEASLPGDRSSSPPPPQAARRVGWNHPVARWTAYVLIVIALTLVFVWLMVDLFKIG